MSLPLRVGGMFLALALLAGCRGVPTVDDARDLLSEGESARSLEAFRGAAERAKTDAERLDARRGAFRASLAAGLSDEAAREYAAIRQLLGREDEPLLTDLSTEALRIAQRSGDTSRRVRAARTLEAVISIARVQVLLHSCLRDEEPEVRAAAVLTLARMPDPGAALTLLEARVQTDDSTTVRLAVLSALGQLVGRPQGDETDALKQRVSTLTRTLLSDENLDVRLRGLDLCNELDDEGAVEALTAAVGDRDSAVALRAAHLLLERSPALAFEAWSQEDPAGAHTDAFGRSLALHTGGGSSYSKVTADLASPDYARRLASLQGLAGPAASRLGDELGRLVREDPAGPVRSAALDALMAGGTPAAKRAAARAALQHADPTTRSHGFRAMERIERLTPAALKRFFRQGDPATVDAAARLLMERGGEDGLRAIMAGLDGEGTRGAALAVLAHRGHRGHPELRERFLQLLQGDDPRARAQGALGLVNCGEARDRALLVQALEDTTDHADLLAAAALLAVHSRQPAKPAATPHPSE